MAPPLSRLDHVIIAVRNLDVAAASYRRLGFTLTPRGLHGGRGTGNHCIMFKDSYIELLGIVGDAGAKGRLAERVAAQGEGGMGIAYGAADAYAAASALRAAGIAAEDPTDLSRPVDLDGKREIVKFRNVMMPGLTLPNVMQFVCTHLTPELTRARHEWQLHPNSATGIVEVVVTADDIDQYWSEMETLFDNTASNVAVSLAARRNMEVHYGTALNGALHAGIVMLRIFVNELDAISAMLEMAKVPHHEGADVVVVPASAAHGVVIEFAEG